MISPTAPGETDQYEGLSTDQALNWAPERDINEGQRGTDSCGRVKSTHSGRGVKAKRNQTVLSLFDNKHNVNKENDHSRFKFSPN